MFTEADFRNLKLDDFEIMYFELRQRTIRPKDVQVALFAVIKVYEEIDLLCSHFKLADESKE